MPHALSSTGIAVADVPHATADALRRARARFVRSFPSRLESLAVLARVQATRRSDVPALRQCAHRLGGLAGVVGFPAVSVRAASLEHLAQTSTDHGQLQRALARLADAFAVEGTRGVTEAGAEEAVGGLQVLVALAAPLDDALTHALAGAGAVPHTVEAERLATVATDLQPDVVLLSDGTPSRHALLQLKCTPSTSLIPVLVVGSAADVSPAGATDAVVGPDGVVVWPASPTALHQALVRIVRRAGSQVTTARRPVLGFDALALTAMDHLRRGEVALGVVGIAPMLAGVLADAIEDALGQADLIARLGEHALVVVAPGATSPVLSDVLDRCVRHVVSMDARGVRPRVGTVTVPAGSTLLGTWVEAAVASIAP